MVLDHFFTELFTAEPVFIDIYGWEKYSNFNAVIPTGLLHPTDTDASESVATAAHADDCILATYLQVYSSYGHGGS